MYIYIYTHNFKCTYHPSNIYLVLFKDLSSIHKYIYIVFRNRLWAPAGRANADFAAGEVLRAKDVDFCGKAGFWVAVRCQVEPGW